MPVRTAPPTYRPAACFGLLLAGLFSAAGVASELRNTPIVRAVERARPAVVNIHGEKTVPASPGALGQGEGGRRVNGMGTGVVIDPRGYILTNHHVVAGVREIQVTMAGGRQSVAELLAHDPETDLAIIKLDLPEKLPMIPLGASDDLMPGETVLAVGNAYGYEHTVTRGIISALHRAVQVSDAQFYDDLIQTDASINPGNSGGPLLNIDGEMIGLNVAVRAGAQGIGFAIPVDQAMEVAAELLDCCVQRETFHGLHLADEPLTSRGGLLLSSVEKSSPAAKSGLRSGDLIIAVDAVEAQRPLDFQRALLERKVGESIRVEVRRGGQPVTVRLTLAKAPQKPAEPNHPTWTVLGLDLKPIPGAEFRRTYRTRYRGGLSVTAVRPDGPAARGGIRRGDVLVGMHIWETVSLDNVSYVLKRADLDSLAPLKFFILRGDQTYCGYLPLGTKTARRPEGRS